MDCKRAGKILKELAVSGAAAADFPGLAAHLASCSACGEAFAREETFVATMNRGIAATVAGEPSPAMRARVREQLAAPARGWEWRWAVVAAAALLAVVISLRALHSRRAQPEENISSPGNEVAAVAPTAETRWANLSSPKHAERERMGLPGFPPVLIEKGEREATMRFLNEVRSGRVDLASLAAVPGPGSMGALEIKPLEITPLGISPIFRSRSTSRVENEP